MRRATHTFRCLCLVACLAALAGFPEPATAHDTANQQLSTLEIDKVQKEALAQSGGTCKPPTASIVETGYNSFKLVFTSPSAARFVAHLNYLETCRGHEPLRVTVPGFICDDGPDHACDLAGGSGCDPGEGISFCFFAGEDDKVAIPFEADRCSILLSGGQLGFRWKRHKNDLEETTCFAQRQGPSDPTLTALRKHYLGFDAGLLMNLEGDGSWDTNLEASLTTISQWRTWFQSGLQMRYSAVGAISEVEPMDDAMNGDMSGEGEGEGDDSETSAPDPQEFNPFDEGEGVFEADLWLTFSPFAQARRVGFVAGAGVTTVPADGNSALESRTRGYYGLAIDVAAFNLGRAGDGLQGARSFLHLAWAEDELFENVLLKAASDDGSEKAVYGDESERYLLKGELELPQVGNDYFRLLMRGVVNVPRSGDGPSDIRVSALISTDPRKWFPGLKPK